MQLAIKLQHKKSKKLYAFCSHLNFKQLAKEMEAKKRRAEGTKE